MTTRLFLVALLATLAGCITPDIARLDGTVPFAEVHRAPDGTQRLLSSAGAPHDALYQAGSISKFACTLAALDMVDDGRMALNQPVAELLPGWTGPANITLAHLLQNRSGLNETVRDALVDDPALPSRSIPSLTAANRFGSAPSASPPGTEFDYVLANWIVLQAVLEHQDESAIGPILENRVFAPAGMADARVFTGDFPDQTGLAAPQGQMPVPDFLSCAGGIAARPAELIDLLRLPYGPHGFAPATLAAMERIASAQSHYALGGRVHVVERDGQTGPLWWLSGSNGAWKSRASYHPATDSGFAVMSAAGDAALLERRQAAWRDTVLQARDLSEPSVTD